MTKYYCIMCDKRERKYGNLFCDYCRGADIFKRIEAFREKGYFNKGNGWEWRNDQKRERKRYFIVPGKYTEKLK